MQLNNYKHYLNFLGESTYLVNSNDILRVFSPKEFTKTIKDKIVLELIDKLSTYLKIPLTQFGIEGSYILQKNNEKSDVDIFVYGLKNANIIKNNFNTLFSQPDFSNVPINIVMGKINKLKSSGFGTDDLRAILQFQKRYYGYYKYKPFSIVCVPEFNEYQYINIFDRLEAVGTFEGEVVIIDDTYAGITPSKYTILYHNNEHTLYIYDHYGINQAKKGDRVYLKCKKYTSKQENDILIIAFWNNYDAIFNNLSLREVKDE